MQFTVKENLRAIHAIAIMVVGFAHFAFPTPFVKIVPEMLPAPLALVYISGFFEILGGVGLLVPRVSRAAALGLIALYIAVFPANINMAVNQIHLDGIPDNPLFPWLRLPFQAVLIAYGAYQLLFNFQQVIQETQPSDVWMTIGLVLTFLFLGIVTYGFMNSLFGTTKFYADPERLKIVYRLFGFSKEVSVCSQNIRCFYQTVKKDSTHGDSHRLALTTNQCIHPEKPEIPSWYPKKWIPISDAALETALELSQYKEIVLYCGYSSSVADWLAQTLAGVYQVEVLSFKRPQKK